MMDSSMVSESVHWTVVFDPQEVAERLRAYGAAAEAGATPADGDPRAAAPKGRDNAMGFRIPANLGARGAGAASRRGWPFG